MFSIKRRASLNGKSEVLMLMSFQPFSIFKLSSGYASLFQNSIYKIKYRVQAFIPIIRSSLGTCKTIC